MKPPGSTARVMLENLSTHPVTGGLMKPRPLKPLSTKAEKYLTVG